VTKIKIPKMTALTAQKVKKKTMPEKNVHTARKVTKIIPINALTAQKMKKILNKKQEKTKVRKIRKH